MRFLLAQPRTYDTDAVLDAVMRTFWTHGWKGTSVDMLARAAGVRKGSLHHAFGNKEDMLIAALTRYKAFFDDRLDGALENPDPAVAVPALFAAVIERMADPANPSGCLSTYACMEFRDLPEAAARLVREGMERQIAKLTDHARTAIDAGYLAADVDPHGQAAAWFAATRGMAAVHRVTNDIDAVRGIAATYTAAFE